MELTPRLLSLTIAVAFVLVAPHGVTAQSAPQPKPASSPSSSPQAGHAPAEHAAAAGASSAAAAAPAAPAPAAAAPPAEAASSTSAPQTTSPLEPTLEPQGYTYSPDGRRDPFISLLRRGTDVAPAAGPRAGGLAGLETGEVTLKGTVATRGEFVGILLGVDNKTYIVKAGDHLLDGTIRTISQDGLVITQQVNDPLSLEKQREVRKVLRQTEEAK